jgi:hypothetical protein
MNCWIYAVLIVALSCLGLQAQEASIEQSRQFRTGPDVRDFYTEDEEESFTMAAPTSEGDEDMGEQRLLREQKRYKHFSVFGGATYYFTDNAFLTEGNRDNDSFFVGNVGVSARYPASDLTTLRASVSQAFYRYNQATNLDFEAFDVFAGVSKVVPPLANIIVSADYHYNRLTYPRDNADGPAGSEFYREHGFLMGISRFFPLSRAHYFFVGANANLTWADPDTSQRNEYAASLGYHVDLTRYWSADASYRVALFDYDGSTIERQDLNQIVSVSTGFTPYEWVTISAQSIFGFNNSDNPELNYEYVNLGGTLSLILEF